MIDHPDYSNYTKDELLDAYSNIDKEKYPERVKLIEVELGKRKSEKLQTTQTNHVKTDAQPKVKCSKCGFENEYLAKFCTECGSPIIDYAKPAGFWIRVGASFLDGLIFIPIIILYFVDLIYWKSFSIYILITLPSVIYKPLLEYQYGATLGKMACEIKVINPDGKNISFKAAFLRSLPNILTWLVGLAGMTTLFFSKKFEYAESFDEIMTLVNQTSGPIDTLFNFLVFIDCLIIAFTHRKRAIHDFLAKTYVVYKKQTCK